MADGLPSVSMSLFVITAKLRFADSREFESDQDAFDCSATADAHPILNNNRERDHRCAKKRLGEPGDSVSDAAA
jgi:hypothetical protein